MTEAFCREVERSIFREEAFVKLKILCDAAGIVCPAHAEELEISSVVTDSREARAGCLFVCIRGLHSDAHVFIGDAVAAGASCILAECGADYASVGDAVYLEAEDTRRAASYLYNAWYGFPTRKLKMIGVTGTNGKTSVTHMLRAILEASLCRCGLIGTVGCESAGKHLENTMRNRLANMTTPDPEQLYRMLAQMVEDGVEYVLMEVTSHALALGKLAPIEFEAAIFTNLTPEHLDFHKNMENYAAAKAELFTQSRLAVVNLDSPYAERMLTAAKGRTVTCSTRKPAAYTAESVESIDGEGVSYLLKSVKATARIRCPIPGEFSVMNSLQAAACALELGIGARAVKDALANMAGIKGRMERVKLGIGADFTVLIDYAHTPDALENLLRTAAKLKRGEGRVVVLFGCGGDRDRGKRPVMGQIASRYADAVILTSDNSRSEDRDTIIGEILTGVDPNTPYHILPDRAEAIRYAVMNARAGDVILLAGKGHEEYEIDQTGRKYFSEKEIATRAYRARVQRKREEETTETEL